VRPIARSREVTPGDHGVPVAFQLQQVLLPAYGDAANGAVRVDVPAPMGVVVEARQSFRDGGKVIVHRSTILDHRCQPGRVGIATHNDHRLGRAVCRSAEVTETQVTIRSQPAIQRHFVLAGVLTKLRSAEVKEIGGQRLLDLVRLVANEKNNTRMGFPHLDVEVPSRRFGLLQCAQCRRHTSHAPRFPGVSRQPQGS